MTQKELGMKMGYPDNSADVRIAQYESGKRVPSQETIDCLATVFSISPMALMVPDMTLKQTMHVLFALADRLHFGLEFHDDSIHLVFRESETPPGAYSELLWWVHEIERMKRTFLGDCLYDAWRYRYPRINENYPEEYDPEEEKSFDRIAKLGLERRKKILCELLE